MNKLSKYANLIELEGHHYLFDLATGKVIAVNKRIADLLEENRHKIDRIKTIHPDFYEGLKSNGMIVEENLDETGELIKKFDANDNDPSSFGIIINPTLDCNLRCWYCYETHTHGTMMSEGMLESVKRLIEKKISEPSLKHLGVSFFGGEPLLGWKRVVLPLLEYASGICTEKGIILSSGFTTNGVLLKEEYLDKLIELGLGKTSFQISLDGNKTFHDNSRVNKAKHPTYDIIMKNAIMAAKRGFGITLRFNYTPDNIETFTDVLSDLEHLPEEVRKNVTCSFHQVWQTIDPGKGDSVRDKAEIIRDFFRNEGFLTGSDRNYYRYVCYGDRQNNLVINFNGDLYKCTAREFSPETREGFLTNEGEIVWNERFMNRMKVKYSNPVCLDCMIMPICNGGCSQNKLERTITNGCPLGNDSKAKDKYLQSALKHILYQ